MFSRDSAIWWLGMAAGIIGFSTGHFELIHRAFPEMSVVWDSRLELLSGLLTFVSAYFRMSPRPLSGDSPRPPSDPTKTLSLLGKGLVIALATTVVTLVASGCAHPRHAAVVADTALFEVLNDIHTWEQTQLCGQPSCAGVTTIPSEWTEAKSQDFNKKLLPAVSAGREFNNLLGDWAPGTPMPAGLSNLIASLSASLTQVTSDFPEGTTKEKILAGIARAQGIILSTLDVLFSGGQ